MGAVGMGVVGLVTSPLMGRVADDFASQRLPVAETVAFLEETAVELEGSGNPDDAAAIAAIREALEGYRADQALPAPATSNALRAVINSAAAVGTVEAAQAILGPADNYGGRISFRYVAPLAGILVLIFGGLFLSDRRAGGYRITRLKAEAPA
jgi:hypothetical protein